MNLTRTAGFGKAQTFRLSYRRLESSTEMGPWEYVTAFINDARGARRLVSEANRRDRGRLIWRSTIALPTDFDYIASETDHATA